MLVFSLLAHSLLTLLLRRLQLQLLPPLPPHLVKPRSMLKLLRLKKLLLLKLPRLKKLLPLKLPRLKKPLLLKLPRLKKLPPRKLLHQPLQLQNNFCTI